MVVAGVRRRCDWEWVGGDEVRERFPARDRLDESGILSLDLDTVPHWSLKIAPYYLPRTNFL